MSLPTLTQVPSPNYSSRQGVAPEAVVVHIMQGTLAGCDSWFTSPASQVSAHFGVGKDGTVHQYVALADAAWANGVVEAGHTAALVDENAGTARVKE